MSKVIIEAKNVSVRYITGDLRNIGLKEFIMKKLTRTYRVDKENKLPAECNAVNNAENKQDHKIYSEIDKTGYIFRQQEHIFRHIDL